jgi:hypothetical protein
VLSELTPDSSNLLTEMNKIFLSFNRFLCEITLKIIGGNLEISLKNGLFGSSLNDWKVRQEMDCGNV